MAWIQVALVRLTCLTGKRLPMIMQSGQLAITPYCEEPAADERNSSGSNRLTRRQDLNLKARKERDERHSISLVKYGPSLVTGLLWRNFEQSNFLTQYYKMIATRGDLHVIDKSGLLRCTNPNALTNAWTEYRRTVLRRYDAKAGDLIVSQYNIPTEDGRVLSGTDYPLDSS